MKIIITSTNPVKRNATLLGFTQMFPDIEWEIVEINVPSGVNDQPMTEAETLKGAAQRVENAVHNVPDADYWVGIEGGVQFVDNGEAEAFAWVIIRAKDGRVGKGRTGTFMLPYKLIELLKQGVELGEADDIVFKQQNSKQKGGTVGTLTRDVIDRTEYYRHAVIFALIPFTNPSLYSVV